jgi:hypothetical protein
MELPAGLMRRFAVALLALGILLLGADAAMACSCVPPDEPKMLRQADGAFVGRLVAVRVVDPPDRGEPIGSGDPTDYVYRVRRVYKRGPGLKRGRRVRVRSVRSEVTCGLPSGRGRVYALFLQRQNRRWHSNLCMTTTPERMRRAAQNRPQEAAFSSMTGICLGARLRYWTQPG